MLTATAIVIRKIQINELISNFWILIFIRGLVAGGCRPSPLLEGVLFVLSRRGRGFIIYIYIHIYFYLFTLIYSYLCLYQGRVGSRFALSPIASLRSVPNRFACCRNAPPLFYLTAARRREYMRPYVREGRLFRVQPAKVC